MIRRILVDGYNVMHAWPDLLDVFNRHDLEAARSALVRRLAEHHASTGVAIVVVFDSRAGAHPSDPHVIDGVEVRFGSAANSADHIIERLCYRASRAGTADEMIVVTNDRLQRDLVRAMGVASIGAAAFLSEVNSGTVERGHEITRRTDGAAISRRVEDRIDPAVRERLERMRRGLPEPDETGGTAPG